jgi:hypothetical protein
VFKALGATPRQTLTMITCSVALTGLIAGIAAVPVGILLHHGVLPAMTHAANSGYPLSLISVYSVPEMIALALAGLVIAVAGALAPASWAGPFPHRHRTPHRISIKRSSRTSACSARSRTLTLSRCGGVDDDGPWSPQASTTLGVAIWRCSWTARDWSRSASISPRMPRRRRLRMSSQAPPAAR